MTDYTPDRVAGPDHLAVGETVSSTSPKVTLGPSKAIVAGATGTVVGFLSALSLAYSDEVVNGGEWISIATATVLAFAAAFGITYVTPTKVTAN